MKSRHLVLALGLVAVGLVIGGTIYLRQMEDDPSATQITHRGRTADEWLRDLRDPDHSMEAKARRDKATQALGELIREHKHLKSPVIKALSDESADVRECAAIVLRSLGREALEAAPHLIELFGRSVRHRELGLTLETMSPLPIEHAPALTALLLHEDIRDHALTLLEQMGAPAVPHLLAAIETIPVEQRCKATELVAAAGKQDRLLAALEELKGRQYATGNKQAWDVLLQEGKGNAEVAGTLAALLENERSSDRRYFLAVALGKIGVVSKEVLQALTATLNATEDYVAVSGPMKALIQFGETSPQQVVPVWIAALKHKSEYVRRTAAYGLGLLGPSAKQAVPALSEALRDEGNIAKNAAEALGNIGPDAKEAAPALARVLRACETIPNRNLEVPKVVCAALPKLGKGAVVLLQARLGDPSAEARCDAAYALRALGSRATTAVPALTACLQDEDAPVRLLAAGALGEIGPSAKPASSALAGLLKDENKEVALESAQALAKIGPDANEAMIAALRETLRQQDDKVPNWAARMRAQAANALGTMGSGARPALPDLLNALPDSSAAVRLSAAKAVWQVDRQEVAVTTMLKLVRNEDRVVGAMTCEWLWLTHKHDAVLPGLIAILKAQNRDGAMYRSPNNKPIVIAARVLARMGPQGLEAAPLLVNPLLNEHLIWLHKRTEHVAAVAEMMAALGPEAYQPIIKQLRTQGYAHATHATELLIRVGSPAAKDAVPLLISRIEQYKQSNAFYQLASFARALGTIGPAAKDAVPTLLEMYRWVRHSDLSQGASLAEIACKEATEKALKKIDPEAARKAGIE